MTTMTTAPAAFDRRLIPPMLLGTVLNPVNSSMIAVALIPIGLALGASPAQTAWLVSGLYLATAVGQPVVGKLVDTYGPRKLYLGGAVLLGLGGLAGALAPDLWVLVIARVLIGFGTCAGYPAAMYLVRREAERTGAKSPAGVLTALAVGAQTVAVVGPTVGGLLIGLGGWRTIFAINVPMALLCLVLGIWRLPRTVAPRERPRFDVIGIGLFAVSLTALLFFLMEPHVVTLWLLALTVAGGAGFALRELRTQEPFLDLRVLGGNGPLLTTYGRNLLAYAVSYAFIYGYTQWLEAGRGLSASHAGLILLPSFLMAIVVSTITGRHRGVRAKLLVGAAAQIVACALLLVVDQGTPLIALIGLGLVVGIPQGLNNLANQNAVFHQAQADRMGQSAGLLRTFTYLGAILASAANGAFLGADAGTAGLHHLAIFMLGAATLMLVVIIPDRSLKLVNAEK
ncbi:MFS transporter [Winogradskya humida]|uniref:MFS transporter n=2 Tax=Winogradskya humida TaxID=113566 RepID=A0ABQ3ZZM2_9ACTN|nr:MFS transporter [Actinoplanes humidus]